MAAKFVSPFISDESEGQAADEGDITIPDAALFNDSLDEGVDPTALLDDADLPVDCAAAEPKPAENLSQRELNDSLSAEDLDETQLPASDGDVAQDMLTTTSQSVARPKADTPKAVTPPQAKDAGDKEQTKFPPETSLPLVEKTATPAACMEGKVVAASSKGAAKVKPSFGKKKKGFTPPTVATKAASTTSQSENKKLPEKTSDQTSSNGSDKSPPESSSPETGADSPKQQPQSAMGNEKASPAETKKVKVADKKMAAEEKKKEKERKEQERALKKQAAEQKKLDREKKKAELERQRNEKKLELERKKAEREQKKMEKELKKMEREQKKAERQAKASQKQQTKDKKTEDASSSVATYKKDKVEASLEKDVESVTHEAQHEPKADEGTDEIDVAKKSGEQSLESNIEEKENIPPNGKRGCEISTKGALSPRASCVEESEIQKTKFSSPKKEDNRQEASEADMKLGNELNETESSGRGAGECEYLGNDATAAASPVSESNGKEEAGETLSAPKKGGDQQKSSDSDVKEKDEVASEEAGGSEAREHDEEKNAVTAPSPVVNKSTEMSRDGNSKQKEKKAKKFSPPKANKDATKATGKEVKKQRKAVVKLNRVGNFSGDELNKKAPAGGKGKKRKASVYSDSEDEVEAKRGKPTDNLSSVWVQCDNTKCKKWRLLRDCDDPAKVPGKWVCSMNADPDRNSCSAEEEEWSDPGDSQEFVESPFIPGSLVWSKMDGYPWWPAMIEEDPNKETYYEMGYRDSPIPVRYHVVFFDVPVSRGWVASLHTVPYTGQNDPNKDGNVSVPQRLKRTLTEGKKQANKAIGLSVKERVETLSFAKRFRGRRRKREAEDSPEALPSQAKYRKTMSNGERKSARLRVSVEECEKLEGAMPVVSLDPLQNQQPDSVEAVSTNDKGSRDSSSLVQQHEE